MKVIALDASAWQSVDDFYSALLPKLGAPAWHGRNLDALLDSLSSDINDVAQPFGVQLQNSAGLPPSMAEFLREVVTVFQFARERGADVSITLN